MAVPVTDQGEPSADAGLQGRTMFSIVWGCLSTIFICTWVSVHPNIPPPKYEEYSWRSLARRFWYMFWTLVAPELILFWSFKQWMAAGKIARIYNRRNVPEAEQVPSLKSVVFEAVGKWVKDTSRGRMYAEELESTAWTRTHGHFVGMGGIILIQPEEEVDETVDDTNGTGESTPLPARKPTETIVDIAIFKELIKDPDFKIDITEEEIGDKSKGDFLSKTIAFLQVAWFITQCVARFAQGLGLTELEVFTLALASLNGAMYFFWSSKPLGLQVPIKIKSRRKVHVERESNTYEGRELRQMMPEFGKCDEDASGIIGIIFVCLVFSPLLIPLAVFYLLALVVAALADVSGTQTIPADATHVPAFYAPKTESGNWSSLVILPTFGSIFGALHCLAWNFTYPTHAERTIWRVSSLIVTLTPFSVALLILFFVILSAFLQKSGASNQISVSNATKLTLVAITLFPTALYVLARLILLVEAFALLRRQPANVFQAIDWIKLFPHLEL